MDTWSASKSQLGCDLWWCTKSLVSWEQRPTESIGGVPAKDLLKVKLVMKESPRTQKCES